ncbi:carbon-nitrogen hydrolase family protein [Rubricoccus marinus]|uniref:Carbon-nitrogen hydrolase n=1 Tax=Rubricoccus marinus TaxID=716817 RepID=A0A259U381_9BACT|nr:nitrilase-related carbon-nitrogen hydrolase [Rubricoccus marinus]OZC04412.1 carbon-nitrogen hydrolase [Rubricoccus marinus]
MKLALVQQTATPDLADNLARGLAAFERAADAGADLVAFAELAFHPFWPQRHATPELLAHAEPIDGPTVTAFRERAAARGVVCVLNLFERASGARGEQTFDASPVIDADGALLGVTRMIHITDYEAFHEQGFYAPGDNGLPVYQTAAGRIGVAICYDRHFPEAMRALALAGAEVVIVPQAGAVGEWPDGLYEAEMQVASFQNGYFTALVNRVGEEARLTFAGESFVTAPDGRVVARAASGADEILYADVDLGAVAESHARRLFLQHRRPELYADWLAR